MIRLLISDDSAFMRIAIRKMVESDPEIEVVGEAKPGDGPNPQARRDHHGRGNARDGRPGGHTPDHGDMPLPHHHAQQPD
jgi:hypothetical protein